MNVLFGQNQEKEKLNCPGLECFGIGSTRTTVFTQKADFTFYGGIYRDISLMVVSRNHIALGHFGDTGVKITPALKDGRADICLLYTSRCV